MTDPLARDLARATDAAHAAGALLLSHWHRRAELTVESKRPGDFVSQADRGAEALLRAALMAPGDGWLGEETEARDAPRRWIVDPLDGTTNFLRGIGQWAVSIALEIEGRRVLGVIRDPLRDETFAAVAGRGAWLNGRALDRGLPPPPGGALWGTGLPFGTMPHIDDHADDLRRVLPDSAGIRRMGAAALDLAYVAAGRLDGFWERRLRPWDIAAGLVICREAGLRVEGWDAADRPEISGNVIAARPELFADLARALR